MGPIGFITATQGRFVRMSNGVLLKDSDSRSAMQYLFTHTNFAQPPRFISSLPLPAKKAVPNYNDEVYNSEEIDRSSRSSNAAPDLTYNYGQHHLTAAIRDSINRHDNHYWHDNTHQQQLESAAFKKDLSEPLPEPAQHEQEALLKSAVILRNQLVSGHAGSNIDAKLAELMSRIVHKVEEDALDPALLEHLYHSLEETVLSGLSSHNDLEKSSPALAEKHQNQEMTRAKMLQFLLICIALGKYLSPYSSFGALFLAMIERYNKQVLTEQTIIDSYNNDDELELEVWHLIVNAIPATARLKYRFLYYYLLERQRQLLLADTVDLRHDSPYPDRVQHKLHCGDDSDHGLQELKLIQAGQQQEIAKFKNAMLLLWFSGGKKEENLPLPLLLSLQNQLLAFKAHNYHSKIIVLIDYKVFMANRQQFTELAQKYSTMLEIEFVEDLSFPNQDLQKLHEIFLIQATTGNPKLASYFYQTALNLEQKLSTALQYSVFIPWLQLEKIILRYGADYIKPILPWRYRLVSSILALVKQIFLGQKNIRLQGVRFFNLSRINVKQFIKDMNHLLQRSWL